MNKDNLYNYIEREKYLIDKEFELINMLSEIRKENKLSQRQLSNIINLKQPQLVKIEKGSNSPQLNTLLKILDACNYTIEFKKRS